MIIYITNTNSTLLLEYIRRKYMIYVIRHGQTDWNLSGKTQGSINIKLNETGISQAQSARKELINARLDAVLCSPMNRCKATAEIICKDRNIPIIEVENLRERNFGEFEGKQKNIDYDWIEFWDWERNRRYKQAENVREFFTRVASVIEEIKKEYMGKDILIVTHSGVCAMIYCYFNNIKPNGKLKIPGTKNCELIRYNSNALKSTEKIQAKLQFRSVKLWQCGILGEGVKNVAMDVCIAIFIKVIQKEMLILMKS